PPPPEADAGCNPIIGDDCVTPFPSSFWEVPDPTTATGYRVALGSQALPPITPPLSTGRYNEKDGFSPATPFLVYFAHGVDTTTLRTTDQRDKTVSPNSPVQVLDYETGERLPVFAEMDITPPADGRHALIVRPQIRLRPDRRYVVAFVGLVDAKGAPLAPAPF